MSTEQSSSTEYTRHNEILPTSILFFIIYNRDQSYKTGNFQATWYSSPTTVRYILQGVKNIFLKYQNDPRIDLQLNPVLP